ncbi:cupin domain-containing protein [Thermovenabulum sp.]|uniref:cupin domain-containing protein n=1 Tax=Thermovenabulum sp. TaxID=3100335 RepID=UPI003C7A27DF
MGKFTVHESEIEGVKRIPPRVSKVLICNKTVGATQISMGVNVTEVGSKIPAHNHDNQEEAMFIVSGKGKLIVEGEGEYELTPGTAIFAPVGVKHEIVNTGDEPIKIVWAYAPPLPEHLNK